MQTDTLRAILDTNLWDPRQTEDAKAQKANRQQQRQRKPTKLPAIAKRSPDPGDADGYGEDAEDLGTDI